MNLILLRWYYFQSIIILTVIPFIICGMNVNIIINIFQPKTPLKFHFHLYFVQRCFNGCRCGKWCTFRFGYTSLNLSYIVNVHTPKLNHKQWLCKFYSSRNESKTGPHAFLMTAFVYKLLNIIKFNWKFLKDLN